MSLISDFIPTLLNLGTQILWCCAKFPKELLILIGSVVIDLLFPALIIEIKKTLYT